MRRPLVRTSLVLGIVIVLICGAVLVSVRVNQSTAQGRATAESLGTQAAQIICATYTARGESPPGCTPK